MHYRGIFEGMTTGVQRHGKKTTPAGSPQPGPDAPWRTVDPDIPCQVASPQSLTPFLRAQPGYHASAPLPTTFHLRSTRATGDARGRDARFSRANQKCSLRCATPAVCHGTGRVPGNIFRLVVSALAQHAKNSGSSELPAVNPEKMRSRKWPPHLPNPGLHSRLRSRGAAHGLTTGADPKAASRASLGSSSRFVFGRSPRG